MRTILLALLLTPLFCSLTWASTGTPDQLTLTKPITADSEIFVDPLPQNKTVAQRPAAFHEHDECLLPTESSCPVTQNSRICPPRADVVELIGESNEVQLAAGL